MVPVILFSQLVSEKLRRPTLLRLPKEPYQPLQDFKKGDSHTPYVIEVFQGKLIPQLIYGSQVPEGWYQAICFWLKFNCNPSGLTSFIPSDNFCSHCMRAIELLRRNYISMGLHPQSYDIL